MQTVAEHLLLLHIMPSVSFRSIMYINIVFDDMVECDCQIPFQNGYSKLAVNFLFR